MSIRKKQQRYDDVIKLLLSHNDFKKSIDYGIVRDSGGDLPGVVAAAYGNYTAQMIVAGDLIKSQAAFTLINEMSEWNEPAVNNIILYDIFESNLSEIEYTSLVCFMTEALQKLLYNRI